MPACSPSPFRFFSFTNSSSSFFLSFPFELNIQSYNWNYLILLPSVILITKGCSTNVNTSEGLYSPLDLVILPWKPGMLGRNFWLNSDHLQWVNSHKLLPKMAGILPRPELRTFKQDSTLYIKVPVIFCIWGDGIWKFNLSLRHPRYTVHQRNPVAYAVASLSQRQTVFSPVSFNAPINNPHLANLIGRLGRSLSQFRNNPIHIGLTKALVALLLGSLTRHFELLLVDQPNHSPKPTLARSIHSLLFIQTLPD